MSSNSGVQNTGGNQLASVVRFKPIPNFKV